MTRPIYTCLKFIALLLLLASFKQTFQPQDYVKQIADNMILVKGGSFMMGSDKGNADEKPVHPVNIKNFYLSKYEVTQEQWETIMGKNPSNFKNCPPCPVDNVSWLDANKFIEKLNEKTGQKYRLPTEAEWEYAARGGNESNSNAFSGSNTIEDVAWTYKNSNKKTHPVGEKMPNEISIWDMTGNVAEWCSDFYDEKYYANSPMDNPKGPKDGNWHTLRGGSWFCFDVESRPTYRSFPAAGYRTYTVGFRLAKDL